MRRAFDLDASVEDLPGVRNVVDLVEALTIRRPEADEATGAGQGDEQDERDNDRPLGAGAVAVAR